MTTRSGEDVVRYASQANGRVQGPYQQHHHHAALHPELFDSSPVATPLNAMLVMDLIDALFEMGPFGLGRPAARHIPAHLFSRDGDIRTTRMIGAGYRC